MSRPETKSITPPWLDAFAIAKALSPEAAVDLSLDLAEKNVETGSGGPFGAVVFDLASGEVVGVGVNRVEETGVSLWHAETVAIHNAQAKIGREEWEKRRFALACSCQPCILCLGAAHWARISEVHFAASREDAEAIGFDEGPGVDAILAGLRERGVKIVQHPDNLRGRDILQRYAAKGGRIY